MMPDRRQVARDRRRALRAPLTAAVVRRVGDTVHLAQSANIGRLGMTLRAPYGTPIAPRTAVTLSFALPGDPEVIHVRGEVVFDRPDGDGRLVGVRFASLDPEEAGRIERFVSTSAA